MLNIGAQEMEAIVREREIFLDQRDAALARANALEQTCAGHAKACEDMKASRDAAHDICAKLSTQLDAHKRALDEACAEITRVDECCGCVSIKHGSADKLNARIRATAKGETK